MQSLPILFFVVVVCLAVVSEAQTTKKPTASTATTKTTARTTTSSVKPTTTSKTTLKPTTTTPSTTTVKKTTTTTSKTTTSKKTTTKPITSKTTTKPSTSTTVKTTSTKPATTTTTAKTTTTIKPTTTSRTTTVKTTSSPRTTTTKASTVSTTKPTTTSKKTTTAGTTPGIPSTTSPKSSSTQRSSSTTPKAFTTSTLVPPTTARATAAPTTSKRQTDTLTSTLSSATRSSGTTTLRTTTTTPPPVLFNCSVSDPACGNMCTNLTSTGGVVQSPNYPGDYGNSSRVCLVTISAPEGWMIQLKFTTFNLETDKAIVVVDDGRNDLLPPTTGDTIPALVPTTTDSMVIGFGCADSSKPSTAIYNWQATFSVSSQGSSCSVLDPACGTMCTNVTSNGTGVVQSPNFPGDYGNDNRDCTVTIVVPAGKRIQLTFTTVNLASGDRIAVYDRSTILSPFLSGNEIPAVDVSTANIMYLQFVADGSTKPTTATYNWRATYTAV